MKKVLCVLLAMASLFALTACKDGKCDDCGTEEHVTVYETEDGDVEYCPSCYAKNVTNNILGGLLG
jgi:hypothetical protein